MVLPVPTNQAPAVVTGNQAGLWQAIAGGLPAQNQQAVQQQLQLMAKQRANLRYMKECIIKKAPALTNGLPTQAFASSTPFTFNLPQPNNAFARGIMIRTTLAYTLATGTGAAYALTAAGSMGLYDTIEVKYNKSQIKIRPLWLRQLALAGALKQYTQPTLASTDPAGSGSTDRGVLADQFSAYFAPNMPVATGAQTYQQDIWIPFNWLSPYETRGLLPAMPGETGIQVVATTAASILGADPVYNSIYATAGTGAAISAVSGTIKVLMLYSDGEVYSQPSALPYDMSILQGTIQAQMDAPLTGLVAGAAQVNRGQLNILGQHYYVGCLVVDAGQSNAYSTAANLLYISSDKDSVGANSFWKYGQGTNMDVNEFWSDARFAHNNHDLDPGVFFFVDAPLRAQQVYGVGSMPDPVFGQFLDNTVNGWPAWHYGVSLNSVTPYTPASGFTAPTARIEPMAIYVNPVGLPPVGL